MQDVVLLDSEVMEDIYASYVQEIKGVDKEWFWETPENSLDEFVVSDFTGAVNCSASPSTLWALGTNYQKYII